MEEIELKQKIYACRGGGRGNPAQYTKSTYKERCREEKIVFREYRTKFFFMLKSLKIASFSYNADY